MCESAVHGGGNRGKGQCEFLHLEATSSGVHEEASRELMSAPFALSSAKQ